MRDRPQELGALLDYSPGWSSELFGEAVEDGRLYTPSGGRLDVDGWVERLRSVRGRVALSGYGTEWDGLGWRRHEFVTFLSTAGQAGERRKERVEVLWTNYQPTVQTAMELEPERFGSGG